jgi:hypothetical protein
MATPPPWQTQMEIGVNQGVSGLGMVRDPLLRAKIAGNMIRVLEGALKSAVDQRQTAMAEVLLWPEMSMSKLASELGLSKSYVGKLAPMGVRQRVAEEMKGERTHWANVLRHWSPMNTTGLGDGRVLYLIASVSRVPGNPKGEWLVQVHNHKTPEPVELESQFHPTEAKARVAGVQMLLQWNEDRALNGSSERRHYAHRGINACGAPLEASRTARNDTITCVDCLALLGLLGASSRGE